MFFANYWRENWQVKKTWKHRSKLCIWLSGVLSNTSVVSKYWNDEWWVRVKLYGNEWSSKQTVDRAKVGLVSLGATTSVKNKLIDSAGSKSKELNCLCETIWAIKTVFFYGTRKAAQIRIKFQETRRATCTCQYCSKCADLGNGR